jgi:predicted component of type VI protein secretion system
VLAPSPAPLDVTMPMLPSGPNGNGHAPPNSTGAARPAELPPGAATLPGRHLALPHLALPGLRWPGRHAHTPQGLAFLNVVEPSGATPANIELLHAELILGRDPDLAEAVFQDRSVSRKHARIVAADGVYRIFDCDSTSGTWINYSPVPPQVGQPLQNGDLINLGRVQLRFQRRDRAQVTGQPARVAAAGKPAVAAGERAVAAGERAVAAGERAAAAGKTAETQPVVRQPAASAGKAAETQPVARQPAAPPSSPTSGQDGK